LSGTDLSWAELNGANLEGANLTAAYLRWADLRYTTLTDAQFFQADGRGAWFNGAKVDVGQLEKAWLSGAIMPDGVRHP
jgi:uncharacterized protein YjbI with pentapeptide repeats